MGKLALLVLVVVALVFWLRFQAGGRRTKAAPEAKQGASIETMVECMQCGVHLPLAEAVTGTSGKMYCSVAHQRASGEGA
jgi:uncharacterized protein